MESATRRALDLLIPFSWSRRRLTASQSVSGGAYSLEFPPSEAQHSTSLRFSLQPTTALHVSAFLAGLSGSAKQIPLIIAFTCYHVAKPPSQKT